MAWSGGRSGTTSKTGPSSTSHAPSFCLTLAVEPCEECSLKELRLLQSKAKHGIESDRPYSFTSNSLARSSVTAKAASPEFLFLRFMTSFPPFRSSIRNDQSLFRILSARAGETGLEGSRGAEMHREEKMASCEGSKGNLKRQFPRTEDGERERERTPISMTSFPLIGSGNPLSPSTAGNSSSKKSSNSKCVQAVGSRATSRPWRRCGSEFVFASTETGRKPGRVRSGTLLRVANEGRR